MDDERLAQVRRWARGLAEQESGPELRAAARAILLLADEVERLRSAQGGAPPPPASVDGLELPESPRSPRRGLRRLLALGGVLAVVLAALWGAAILSQPSLAARGPHAPLVARGFGSLVFSVRGAHARWTLDGRDVTASAVVRAGRSSFSPGRLADGEHRVRAAVAAAFLRSASRVWRFTVDTTPPRLDVPRALEVARGATPRLRGRLEPGASLALDGRRVAVRDGRFSVAVPRHAVTLRAVDPAGNATERRVDVLLAPRRPPEPLRAVHVTSYAWATPGLRRGIVDLIEQDRIDAVELDLKDESGSVGFGPEIPLARKIGSSQKIYDLRKAIAFLHRRGVRVVGRIVCFRDPILAGAAWKAGERDEVVQTPGGGPYSGYGGFTNFANDAVRRYEIAVARAAAADGIDEILYDYVRRPDGPISSMVFPGLRGTPEQAIVGFLAETRRALAPWPRVYLGASVFGVAATRPREVAQDIPAMAREVDYIAPMVYPSHWGRGEYEVADPNVQPYEIVLRSLRDFERDVRGTGARVVPWLQDFSLGVAYGPREVRAQILAARTDGIDEWILWDPAVTYTAAALTRDARRVHAAPRAPAPAPKARGLRPNELGEVPVIMHHEIRPDRVGAFDQTPAEFRHELADLWRRGYYPVRASDLVDGRLDVPAGKTPVVLTFDDSTRYQFGYDARGRIDPDTAIGIMLAFRRAHPGFPLAGTFYVLREPFAGVARGPAMLRWLVAHGFELGNHTRDHLPLRTLSDARVQQELAQGLQVIEDAVPRYRVETMALPLGSMPRNAELAVSGSWHGIRYSNRGVFLVGANPAPSPFDRAFDARAIPRIRSSHLPWDGSRDLTWAYWDHELALHPALRYVSDGDRATISFPRAESEALAPRFRRRARAY